MPFADTSTYQIPEHVSDEEILMLADILPTGYEVGVLNGNVRPGDLVAVVGAGPVGLAAITTAQLFSPSHIVAIDLSDARLEAAKHFGADVVVNNSRQDPLRVIRDLTGDLSGRLGADVSIEAVGVPETFELAVKLIRPGGRIANVGVHGAPATLDLEDQWIRDITITTGPGRHLLHSHPASPGRQRPDQRQAVHHPPLHHGSVRPGVRRLQPLRGDRRAQGRPHPRR